MTLAEKLMEKGMEKGIEKGITQARRKTAINFLKMGLTIEQVAKGSELTVKEVEELMEEIAH